MEWISLGLGLIAILLFVELWRRLRVFLRHLRRWVQPKTLPVIGGQELLYQDDAEAPALLHHRYRIRARPDHIVRDGSDIVVVENKGRDRGPYESDWLQAFAGALAARGSGYAVNKVRWVNGVRMETRSIPAEDAELFRWIEPHYRKVQSIRQGQTVSFHPHRNKCRACIYRPHCTRAIG